MANDTDLRIEKRRTRSDARTYTGKAFAPGTLLAAAATLEEIASNIREACAENPAKMHYAELKWEYDAGPCTMSGRGEVTWTLKTWTSE